jgi:WD40 repeat protein
LTHTLKTYSDFAEGFESCKKLVYSSDGKYIASASSGGTARLWDTASGKVVQFFTHDGPVNSVDISPDEKYILTGGADRLARLWDAQTGELARTYVGHSDAIYDVAFSSDGSFIVTGSADTTVRIWDTELADTVKRVCSLLSRDFTNEERLRYSIPDNNSTCEN